MKTTLRIVAWSLPWLAGLSACGSSKSSSYEDWSALYDFHGPELGTGQAKLNVRLPADRFFMQITGSGFESNVPLGVSIPVEPEVVFTTESYGAYSAALRVFANGADPIIDDDLHWIHDQEVPPAPVVSFSERATNDAYVELLVSRARGPSSQELWVAGDLADAESAAGRYYPIVDDRVELTLSDGDGAKTLRARLRNEASKEGPEAELEILRLSEAPQDCRIEVASNTIPVPMVDVALYATSPSPLYYRVFGDVPEEKPSALFVSGDTVMVPIIGGNGERTIVVSIEDLAGNVCLRQPVALTVDSTGENGIFVLADGAKWTDVNDVVLDVNYPALPGSGVKVRITGNVDYGDLTEAPWLPIAAQMNVKLKGDAGVRRIYVQIVNALNVPLAPSWETSIFLRPFLALQGSAPPYKLAFSAIPDLQTITLTGCVEHVAPVAYSSNQVCTPTGTTVSALYDLGDGTSVTRSADVP